MSKINLKFINFEPGHIYHIYLDSSAVSQYIKIRKKGWVINPPKGYNVRKDNPHDDHGMKHIHIYQNGEFVVINQDGSRRHGKEDSVELPQKLYDWLKENFPDFNIPKNIQLKDMELPKFNISLEINFDN